MSIERRPEPDLRRIFVELGAGAPPDYAGRILEQTARTGQRPAWAFPGRWLPDWAVADRASSTTVRWRLIVAIALLVLALLAVIGSAVGARHALPAPFGPARNGQIVYGDSGDLYQGDPVTGVSHLVVGGPAYDSRPQFSPDGTMISFLRRVDPAVDGKVDLMVASADGSGARPITSTPLPATPGFRLWTPDGRSITLLATDGPEPVLEAFDVARQGPPRSINPPGLTVDTPWAFQPPDGRRILFRGLPTGTDELGLYVMNPDGTGVTPVIRPYASPNELATRQDLAFAAWSPDGTRIAVQQMSTDGGVMGVWVMNADGSAKRLVGHRAGDAFDGWTSWSPDGTRLVFQRATGATNSSGYLKYTYRVVRLADDAVVDTGPELDVDSLAYWSPDSTQLLLVLDEGQRQLYLDPAGGPARQVQWVPVGGDWQRLP